MARYNVGDKVKIIGNFGSNKFRIGEIVKVKDINKHPIGIKVEHLDGHNWWWVNERDITPVAKIQSPYKVIITTDGETTLARLYNDKKVTKTAQAKCSPDDEFDFMTGAKIAFDRLIGKPEQKPQSPTSYTGKVVCVESRGYGCWTVGKVYDVANGLIFDDGGWFWGYRISSAEGISVNSSIFYAKFIAIKEEK